MEPDVVSHTCNGITQEPTAKKDLGYRVRLCLKITTTQVFVVNINLRIRTERQIGRQPSNEMAYVDGNRPGC